MRAIWTLCLVLLLVALVACGGSSSSPVPPPAANNAGYSNASLSGSYVFRLSGIDTNGGTFVAVGIFTADGNGNVTSGQEDVNDVFSGVLQQVAISNGTYSVGVDGRGQATLNFSNSAPAASFNFVLVSSGEARVVELSNFELSSGVLEKQNAVPLAAPSGTYVLRMDGSNSQFGQPVSRVGLLTATGAGSASVVLDENYNGFFTPTIAVSGISVSSFSGTTGRGVMQFDTTTGGANSTGTTIDLAFYVVNSNTIEFLSINQSEQLSGYADSQSGTISSASVSSPYVFGISGNLGRGLIDETGEFTLASGALNNGLEDFVFNGAYSASVPFSGTYAADTANNGRFTGSYTSNGRTASFVLWFNSAQNAVMLTYNSTNSLLESGLVTMQPAVPTAATISGNYALHLAGFTGGRNSAPTVLEAQLLADGVGTLTGLEDFNQGGSVATGVSASGSYSVVSGRGTGVIGGIPVVLYPAGSSTIYVMSTDGSTLAGLLEAQH